MRNGVLRKVVACSLVAALGLGPRNANAWPGDIVDLGIATGYGINNSGQVALDIGIYSNGVITQLPALPAGSTPAAALAINASGQVAGAAIPPAVSGPYPIEYTDKTLINLLADVLTGTLASSNGAATGINTGGLVVGWYLANPAAQDYIAFTYYNGTLTDLPDFPCTTFNAGCSALQGPKAFGINDSDQITGSVSYLTGLSATNSCAQSTDAFIYGNGSWSDLGPGAGYAINAGGQVTGALAIINNSPPQALCQTIGTNAFLYTAGTTIILGTLPGGKNSSGYAVNATGQVVGSSDFTGSSATHAFFYNGVMTDLNSIISQTDPLKRFVTLSTAVGINDSRLILANGVDSRTNLGHAYLIPGPWINLAPGSLSFGMQAVGGVSPPQSVVLTNAGPTAIALGTASVDGDFSVHTSSCGASLAASGQCTITVAFTPTVVGARTGGLTVPATGTNYVVTLSGIAPITASISASSSTALVGTPITITWASSPGSTCTAADDSQNPSFNGSVAPSGNVSLTETAAGSVHYRTHCTAPGTSEVDPVTSVVWTWPPVTATLSASPTSFTAGQSTTLSWTSSHASSCSATGGAAGDGWAGALATSGTQKVTESHAPANPSATLTFGITCSSAASGLAAQASVNVVENQPPSDPLPAKPGGGGAFDLLSLVGLLGALGMRRPKARIAIDPVAPAGTRFQRETRISAGLLNRTG